METLPTLEAPSPESPSATREKLSATLAPSVITFSDLQLALAGASETFPSEIRQQYTHPDQSLVFAIFELIERDPSCDNLVDIFARSLRLFPMYSLNTYHANILATRGHGEDVLRNLDRFSLSGVELHRFLNLMKGATPEPRLFVLRVRTLLLNIPSPFREEIEKFLENPSLVQ